MKRIFSIMIIFILILIVFSVPSNASTLGEMTSAADDFLTETGNATSPLNITELTGVSSIIYNVFLTVGIIAAVIIAAVLGIKYMMGSASEKAEVKESLIPFVIGCVVVFGAFGLWRIFVNVANNIF